MWSRSQFGKLNIFDRSVLFYYCYHLKLVEIKENVNTETDVKKFKEYKKTCIYSIIKRTGNV